jgi:hypothetical protein
MLVNVCVGGDMTHKDITDIVECVRKSLRKIKQEKENGMDTEKTVEHVQSNSGVEWERGIGEEQQ